MSLDEASPETASVQAFLIAATGCGVDIVNTLLHALHFFLPLAFRGGSFLGFLRSSLGLRDDLVVIDCTSNEGMVIAGNDPVSTDTVAIKELKLDASKIGYLKLAEGKGLGKSELSEIEVKSEKL